MRKQEVLVSRVGHDVPEAGDDCDDLSAYAQRPVRRHGVSETPVVVDPHMERMELPETRDSMDLITPEREIIYEIREVPAKRGPSVHGCET